MLFLLKENQRPVYLAVVVPVIWPLSFLSSGQRRHQSAVLPSASQGSQAWPSLLPFII